MVDNDQNRRLWFLPPPESISVQKSNKFDTERKVAKLTTLPETGLKWPNSVFYGSYTSLEVISVIKCLKFDIDHRVVNLTTPPEIGRKWPNWMFPGSSGPFLLKNCKMTCVYLFTWPFLLIQPDIYLFQSWSWKRFTYLLIRPHGPVTHTKWSIMTRIDVLWFLGPPRVDFCEKEQTIRH